MDIRTPTLPVSASDVYTDINSLNNIKNEKDSDEALKKVAQQFESLFVHELLKNMRSANQVFEEDSLFNSSESNFFRDMYDQQLSVDMAKKGIGLADALYNQMRGQYGGEAAGAEKPAARQDAGAEPAASLRKMSLNPYGESFQVSSRKLEPAAASTPMFSDAKDFIDAVLPKAKKAAQALGINPLVLAAQAALETGWGKFMVNDKEGQNSHNLFNIKADSRWDGEKMSVSTTEFYDGKPIKENANFRAYATFDESFNDFVDFLQSNPRYQPALAVASDPEAFVQQLHKAGYATDPNYSAKVLSVYHQLVSSGVDGRTEATE